MASQITKCKCGSIVLSINLPPTLGLVCYSKHYEGENSIFDASHIVDLTQIYPSVMLMAEGAVLVPCSVEKGSSVQRVFTSCCNTHMFDIGSVAAMLRADLLDEENEPAAHFRMMASDSLQLKNDEAEMHSWNIPFAWLWTSPDVLKTEKIQPTPTNIGMAAILRG